MARSGSILGNSVLRLEDPKFLTTGATYVDDVVDPLLDGAAFVHYVRSPFAHATVVSVDVAEALASPGVLAVVTGADLEAAGLGSFPTEFPAPYFPQTMPRSFLATDRVRYVGEAVVAIVAESRGQAADAAEQVVVEYDPLKVVVDPLEAITNETLLHPGHGSNTALANEVTATDGFEEALLSSEVIIRTRMINSKIAPAPLEPRSAAAAWSSDGRLNHWVSCQGPHVYRGFISRALNLPEDQIRVITPDVGGGFGAKAVPYPEDVLLGHLAKLTGRPVRWFSQRSEDMVNLGHGRAQIQDIELGGTRAGKITSYRLKVVQDAGAFPRYGAMLPGMTKLMQPGIYDIENVSFESVSVLTNTTPVVPFRGAGRPEATAAIERVLDMFANEIGLDPVEVRRINMLPAFGETFRTKGGADYDCGDYPEMLARALEAASYPQLRHDQAVRRSSENPKLLGIGVSTYVEVTAGGPQSEYARVEVLANGKVRAHTGSTPYGTGHDTSWAMLVADRLGVEITDVEVVHGDTDEVARGGLTGGSRSLQIAGSAISGAAGLVVEQARAVASHLLEANVDDVQLDTNRGLFHVAGSPSITRSWADVAAAADVPLIADLDYKGKGATFPSGAHISVVEVDAETGKVTLLRHVACDDAGRILNPLLVAGQVHGGIAQGAAQALMEEMRYDEDGNPITSNFADYAIISSAELPMVERVTLETPSPLNELGAKGIGESGTIGATPAVHNAVIDALAHLGVRHIDMPMTSEKVWLAIQTASAR